MIGFPSGSVDKESTCNAADLDSIPGFTPEDVLEQEMATESSILVWRVP